MTTTIINQPAAKSPLVVPSPRRSRAGAAFPAKLTFDRVERRYGGVHALAGVSLDIAAGEVVCLLGPSGCGKTTLLRVASGIEKTSGGRVLIDDFEVSGPNRFVPPEKRNVGLMFQDFALFPHLTVSDNVAFGLKALSKAEARTAARNMLARVGLERYRDAYPHVLSGGEQQRVALARAVAPRPAVMLMDEPFSGLDVQLRTAMQDETLTLLRETRATTLIVTHHPEEAMRLGDRIAVMRRGRLVQVGTAEQLYRHPADLFVARMFSEINETPVEVIGGALRTPVGTFRVPGLDDGDAVVLCLRQRALQIVPKGQGLDARVLHAKFLGDAAQVEVSVAGFEAPLRLRVSESLVPEKGTEIGIEIDPASVLIFPADRDDGAENGPGRLAAARQGS